MKHLQQLFTLEYFCVLLFTIAVSLNRPVQATEANSYVIDDFSGVDVTVSAPNIMSVDVVNSNLILSIECSENKKRAVHIPVQHDVKDQKLRISITKNDRLPYMGKFEKHPAGHPIRSSFQHNYLDYQKNPVEFSLENKSYDELSLYFKCRKSEPGVIGTVQIDKIEIVPEKYTDDRDFAYILAELLLFFFLVPGFLLYSLFFERGNKERLLALLTPLSIFFFLFLYIVLLVNKSLSPLPDSWVLLTGYAGFNAFLLVWLGAKNELAQLIANIRLVSFEILAIAIVMFGVAAIVTKNMDLPLLTITYNSLRYLTYGALGAHDPIFQYVNGIAILHDEPFSKYYEYGKLMYGVQDRGVLVGVMYAVVRGIVNPFNTAIANSYGLYTLFGSILNVLVLLPVFALHKYFFVSRQRPLLILLLISASAFVVTNYYITWFKLAGAGLVISGIVLLLVDKKSTKQWALTGVVWGLATNFHPSLALTYPIVTIWLIYRFMRARGRVFPGIVAFVLLVGSFAVLNAPWTIVKATHYQDTNKLFRQHFLESQLYDQKLGIAGSIKAFAGKYTLEEQVSRRYDRLARSLRIKELVALIELPSKANWQKVLTVWNRFEASYIAFALIPFIILLALSTILTRLLPGSGWSAPIVGHSKEFWGLMVTQLLTIFLIIIGSLGSSSPDITWHIPLSCLVIVMYLLIQQNLAIGKIGASLIVVYSLFTHWRLFFQFF